MPPPKDKEKDEAHSYKVGEKVLCFHGEILYEAKVLDTQLSDPNDKKSSLEYLIHYKGWKSTWDDWVSVERMRKDNEENRELARDLKKNSDVSRSAASKSSGKRRHGDDIANLGDEKPMGRGKRARDNDIETEDEYYRRPEVHLPIPDHLKSILVDDWENVTKNLELVKLPSQYPVNIILDIYRAEELTKRRPGSADSDLLEEFIAGLKTYFSHSLGRILLYTFERHQYMEERKKWVSARPGSEWEGKGPGDSYGAEHLARLMVKLPELVAQTNMDKQSVDRLREETTKLALWLARHSGTYFTENYDKASPDYVANAKGQSS